MFLVMKKNVFLRRLDSRPLFLSFIEYNLQHVYKMMGYKNDEIR